MSFSYRKERYEEIEKNRDTKVLLFVTGTRQGLEIGITRDCIGRFVELLDEIGPTERISLILHTDGGDILSAWQLVNLIRMYCEDLEVIVPFTALSAGTLIAIGANKIIMTKQATLGPIDPSVTTPLNPMARGQGIETPVSISVENVRSYLDVARKELHLTGEKALSSILKDLTDYIHPLVLGEVFRAQSQIRFLAEKLLRHQITDKDKVKLIIDFLCRESGSHDYTINRKEAIELGLRVKEPSDSLYQILREIQTSYANELKFWQPFNRFSLIDVRKPDSANAYSLPRGLIEGSVNQHFHFITRGVARPPQISSTEIDIVNHTSFEGWTVPD